jgi:hypothetical protein
MDQDMMERLLAQMEASMKADNREMIASVEETKTAINSLRSALTLTTPV